MAEQKAGGAGEGALTMYNLAITFLDPWPLDGSDSFCSSCRSNETQGRRYNAKDVVGSVDGDGQRATPVAT